MLPTRLRATEGRGLSPFCLTPRFCSGGEEALLWAKAPEVMQGLCKKLNWAGVQHTARLLLESEKSCGLDLAPESLLEFTSFTV